VQLNTFIEMEYSVDKFEKEENHSIFRLGILGTTDQATTMAANFEGNLCNTFTTDNLEDLVFWEPHTIMIVNTEDPVVALHELYQHTHVAINVFQKIESFTMFQILNDYRGLDSIKRTAYCTVDGLVGGDKTSVDNYKRLNSYFAYTIPHDVAERDAVSAGEASIVGELLDRRAETGKSLNVFLEDVEKFCSERGVPTNRIFRLMRAVDSYRKS